MRIRLIDVDSKFGFPNLALLQISAAHKAQGDEVGFDVQDPDKVYISCIFTKNRGKALGIGKMFPDAEIIFGGSGINFDWLPEKMQKIKPDYDLYPSTYSQGFTTRGCMRICPFCIVPKKEGRIQKWQHPSEFHDKRFDTCMIMDNNLFFAGDEWIRTVFSWFKDNGVKMMSPQGWDARLLTEERAQLLKSIKHVGVLHFAWDYIEDEPSIKKAIHLLKDTGFNLRRDVAFYVLSGFNTTIEQDIYRCQKLKEMGTNAFVMPYKKSSEINRLARWANKKQLFWTCDFKDYDYNSHRNGSE